MRDKDHREQLESMMKRPIPRKKVGIVRLQAVREGKTLYGMKRYTNPEEAAEMVRPLVEYADREMMLVLTLDNVNAPIGVEIAAVGGLNACYIDIKSVFKFALLNNAAGVILFHNHPSGNAEESREDVLLTKRIQNAANILGIRLLDHIIIGSDGKYRSFRESEIIDFDNDKDKVQYAVEGGVSYGKSGINKKSVS